MKRIALLAFALAALAPAALAQERTLRVGTKETPPFAMMGEDGRWTGISVELLRDMAAIEPRLELEFADRKTLDGLLDGVRAGGDDVAAAALTVTEERETEMDFTHPFFLTGLGIAVSAEADTGFGAILGRVFSAGFLKVLGLLLLLLLAMGFLVWIFERRKNAAQFGGSPAHGLASGLWWSAVTMTTVGYGDKAPVTVLGRVVGLIWMFAAIIVISSFTASMAQALTVAELKSDVQGPADLGRVRVGTVGSSTSGRWLTARGIGFRGYETVAAALDGLDRGEVKAVVYDRPLLRYYVKDGHADSIAVLPATFESQSYAFGLPEGSPLREDLNRRLLTVTKSDRYADLVRRWLGD